MGKRHRFDGNQAAAIQWTVLREMVAVVPAAIATAATGGASTMAYADPNAPRPQPVSDTTIAMIVYALYFASYIVTGLPALIGVIVAHIQVDTADPLLQSHYRFQIRTFWIGLLYLVAGIVLCLVLVGVLVLLWWLVWSLVRNIKGILSLNEGRPIANPTSWLFG